MWIDGEPREVGPVAFAEGLDAVGDLRFAPEAERVRRDDLLLIASDYRQPFGTFAGTLPDGTELASGTASWTRTTARSGGSWSATARAGERAAVRRPMPSRQRHARTISAGARSGRLRGASGKRGAQPSSALARALRTRCDAASERASGKPTRAPARPSDAVPGRGRPAASAAASATARWVIGSSSTAR